MKVWSQNSNGSLNSLGDCIVSGCLVKTLRSVKGSAWSPIKLLVYKESSHPKGTLLRGIQLREFDLHFWRYELPDYLALNGFRFLSIVIASEDSNESLRN